MVAVLVEVPVAVRVAVGRELDAEGVRVVTGHEVTVTVTVTVRVTMTTAGAEVRVRVAAHTGEVEDVTASSSRQPSLHVHKHAYPAHILENWTTQLEWAWLDSTNSMQQDSAWKVAEANRARGTNLTFRTFRCIFSRTKRSVRVNRWGPSERLQACARVTRAFGENLPVTAKTCRSAQSPQTPMPHPCPLSVLTRLHANECTYAHMNGQ